MLYSGERIDEIGFSDLKLIQKPEEFCYGVDAVILADFAARKTANRIVDLGTGTGIIPLILSHKTKAESIYGIEYQQESWQRAVRNAALNGLSERLHFVQANVAEFDGLCHWADAVTANPPYMAGQCGLKNQNEAKTIARHETVGSLGVLRYVCLPNPEGLRRLLPGSPAGETCGSFSACRSWKLEPKEMRLVAPQKGETPNLVLLHCVKNGGIELKFLENLYIYQEKGVYSNEIQQIYERFT